MKILLVAHFFPPNRTAGAEKRALGYALTLQKLGHQVQVVCAGNWEVGRLHWNGFTDEVCQGVSVRRVNLNWMKAKDPNRSLYDNPLVEEHLSEWLKAWQPDAVHIISLMTLGAGVVRAVKNFGVPIVFTLTDFWMICPKISLVHGNGSLCDGRGNNWRCLKCQLWNTRLYDWLTKLFPEKVCKTVLLWASQKVWLNRFRGLRGMALDMGDRRQVMTEIASKVDRVIAPSSNLGKVIQDCGVFPDTVKIIHSGHDLSWLNDFSEFSSADVIRFGFIGQLIPVKGVDVLIQAFQAAGNNRKKRLVIYGGAKGNLEYLNSLKTMTGARADIHFMGAFQHENLGKVLAGIDVLVVPSQWHENNPRVIQEAFAAKVPVIASDVGGICEFIEHDVNGLLFEHKSAVDLTAQIERVLNDPALLERLKRGIKPVKTIAEEMNEVIEIYQNLVSVSEKVQ